MPRALKESYTVLQLQIKAPLPAATVCLWLSGKGVFVFLKLFRCFAALQNGVKPSDQGREKIFFSAMRTMRHSTVARIRLTENSTTKFRPMMPMKRK